jgi:hypothetical protein
MKFPVAFVAALIAALLAMPTGAGAQKKSPPPIIDVHTHLIGRPMMLPGALKVAEGFFERYAIEKLVFSHVPAGGKDVMYKFAALRQFLQGDDRFAFLGGGGTLNPMIHRHDADSEKHKHLAEEFDKIANTIIRAGGAGYGEMSSLHISAMPGHEYNFQPADHPLFRRLADMAARHDVPIEIHNDAVEGVMMVPRELGHNGNPGNFPGTIKALERLLACNAQAKISWAHGGSDPLGEMTPKLIQRMMDKYANLYMSLRIDSGTGRGKNLVFDGRGLDADWLALLKRHPDRFFIGTDAMFVAPQIPKKAPPHKFAENNDTRYQDAARFLSLLPDDLALKIASGNAKRIYRLSPRSPAFAARGVGAKGQKKKFLQEAKIIATVTGNTLRFNAPSNGRPMRVYFGDGGQLALKAGDGNRIIRKRWFIKDGKFLCRTFGRKNKNHCTLVRPGPDGGLLLFNKKLRYQAKLLKGRQLGN